MRRNTRRIGTDDFQLILYLVFFQEKRHDSLLTVAVAVVQIVEVTGGVVLTEL
jgi:hypothetical protein